MKVITSELLRKFFNKLSDIFAKKSEVLTGGRQTTTSSADDGVNVYTFSDGSTISVKNGSKGSTGAANLANNLTTTGSGYALDARQGKALADKISTHTHTSMKDCGDGREITFAYSKEGLPLSESPWIATWHGGELRAISRDLLVPSLVNNLTTTGAGHALDARQGKVLNDSINHIKQWETTLSSVELDPTSIIRIDSPHEYYAPNNCYVFTKDIIEISIVSAGYNLGVHMTLGKVYRSNGKFTADGVNTSLVTFEIDNRGYLAISLTNHYSAHFIMRYNNGITQIASTI